MDLYPFGFVVAGLIVGFWGENHPFVFVIAQLVIMVLSIFYYSQ